MELLAGFALENLAKAVLLHRTADEVGKVKLTFRVVLARQDAEALATRAVREEKNIGTVVTEILEAVVRKPRP